jgi:hypothetical protein
MNAETADTNGRRNNDLAFEVLPFEDGRPGLNHGIYCQPFRLIHSVFATLPIASMPGVAC